MLSEIFDFIAGRAVRGSTSLFETNQLVTLAFPLENPLSTEVIDRCCGRRLGLIEISPLLNIMRCTLEVVRFALVTDAEQIFLPELFFPPPCLLFEDVWAILSQLEPTKELLSKVV